MMTFERVLFPVDFSDRCRAAAPYVRSLAAAYGSKLTMLHVVNAFDPVVDVGAGSSLFEASTEERTLAARQMLESYLDEELHPLRAERRLEIGVPASTILDVANSENFDLIMMPTHGYGGFRRFLLGSTTAKVLHDAQCPVWTAAHAENTLSALRIDHIACAVDVGSENEAVLKFAALMADDYAADLTVIHVAPTSDSGPARLADTTLRNYLMSDARERLQAICANLQIDAKVCVEAGSSIAAMVSAAAAHHQAGLLLIGRSQHRGLGRLKTHSYAIIREAECPVLSI